MIIVSVLMAGLMIGAIFSPPDFDMWNDWKLWLLSANPLKQAAGFIMCTLYAIEFIVWYCVMYQLMRIIAVLGPVLVVYMFLKYLLS